MKKHLFSVIFAILVVALHFFSSKVNQTIMGWTSQHFATYIVYGLFVAFFLVLVIKAFSKSNLEIGGVLLSAGLISFMIFSHPDFQFQLSVLALFAMGVIPAVEGKKTKSLVPFLLIAAVCVMVEFAINHSFNSGFNYMDVWRNSLIALTGYVSGCLLV